MTMKGSGCRRGDVAKVDRQEETYETQTETKKEVSTMNQVQVGRKAPDFEANAYYDGDFKPVKLSDYTGKWLLLCFYPGDFTFV